MRTSAPEKPLLELTAVTAGYAHGSVVRDVSLRVGRGEVVALLGPNGAGKTTVLNAISAAARVTGGTISLDSSPLVGISPHAVARQGVAHVPQGRRLFPQSNGRANLQIGAFTRRDRQAVAEDVSSFVDQWPVAGRVLDRPAGLMSGGEQQVIAIGRGLLARPRLLLLDEPSLGLAPILVRQLFDAIEATVSAPGDLGVLLVEQHVDHALRLADRVVVLVDGRVVADTPSSELDANHLRDFYLRGRSSAR